MRSQALLIVNMFMNLLEPFICIKSPSRVSCLIPTPAQPHKIPSAHIDSVKELVLKEAFHLMCPLLQLDSYYSTSSTPFFISPNI